MADHLLSSVGDGIQVNNSGQLLYLTDEAGNRITDELGNYITTPFGGIVLEFAVNITAGEAYQINASGAPSVYQSHVISVSDSVVANAAEEPDLTSINLIIADAVQENNSGEIYYLADEDGNKITDEAGNLIVIDWFGGLILTENEGGDTSVTAADGTQVNEGDSPSLRQAHVIASVADGVQANSGDAPSIIQAHLITVDDGVGINAAENAVIVPEGSIGTDSCIQVNTAGGPALIQHYQISIADSAVANTGDSSAPAESIWVATSDGVQVNAGDGVALIPWITFTISDAANLSVAEALVVLIGHAMSPQDSGQVNEADAITLIHGHTLTIGDGTQLQYADGIDFGDTVEPDDAYCPNTADGIILEMHARVYGKKSIPSIHPVRDKYRQSKVYVNTYRRAGDVWRSR